MSSGEHNSYIIYAKAANPEDIITSVFRFETKIVHLSLVPLIPGGKPPPKAAAIAAALPT